MSEAKRRYPVIPSVEDQQVDIQHLKAAYEFLPVHVHIADPNGNILYINPAGVRVTGYSLEEALGKNPGDLWGGHAPKEYYQEMWQALKVRHEPFIGEIENIAKNGAPFRQRIHIVPVLSPANDVLYFVTVQVNL